MDSQKYNHVSLAYCLLDRPNALSNFKFPFLGFGFMGTQYCRLKEPFPVRLALDIRLEGVFRNLSRRYGPLVNFFTKHQPIYILLYSCASERSSGFHLDSNPIVESV